MLRTLIVALVVLGLGAGAAPARDAGGTVVAFVALEDSDELVAVELTTRRIVERIRVPDGPRNVTTSGDLRYVLVTSPPAGTVTLLDGFTGRVLKRFASFGRPLDVTVEGDRAYVTDARRNQLVIASLSLRRIRARVQVSSRPHSVAVGDVALVTHSIPENFLTIVYLGRTSGRGPVRLGRMRVRAVGLGDVSEQPDSAHAYVTLTKSAGVAAIDWGERRPRWSHYEGAIVRDVQFDYGHGRRVWASNPVRGEIFSLSSRTGRPLRRLRGCPGAGPIAFGGQAWIVATCRDEEALAIWSTRTWTRTLVPLGGRPHGVAVAVVP